MISTKFSSSAVVEDIVVTSLKPAPRDPKYNKYLPKYYFPEHFSAVISPISSSAANCLRRTIDGELLVKALDATHDDINTTDDFILPSMMTSRLSMIPLDQSCPADTIFELSAVNNTAVVRDVPTSEFKIVSGGKGMKHIPFNDTTVFVSLQPGKSIKITNIRVNQSYSHSKGHGAYCVAVNTSSVAVGEGATPIDTFDPETKGTSTSVTDHRKWRVAFTTNGTMSPHDIMSAACNSIIRRLTSVITLLSTMSNLGTDNKGNTEYMIIVPGESDSIGNIIVQTVSDLYPDIDAITYATSLFERSCTIRIRCADDVEEIFRATVAALIELFKSIEKTFRGTGKII